MLISLFDIVFILWDRKRLPVLSADAQSPSGSSTLLHPWNSKVKQHKSYCLLFSQGHLSLVGGSNLCSQQMGLFWKLHLPLPQHTLLLFSSLEFNVIQISKAYQRNTFSKFVAYGLQSPLTQFKLFLLLQHFLIE